MAASGRREVVMDVQFSGAVDFAPLFNYMPRPAPAAPKPAAGGASAQAAMLQSQQSLLGPLSGGGMSLETNVSSVVSSEVGANLNIWV